MKPWIVRKQPYLYIPPSGDAADEAWEQVISAPSFDRPIDRWDRTRTLFLSGLSRKHVETIEALRLTWKVPSAVGKLDEDLALLREVPHLKGLLDPKTLLEQNVVTRIAQYVGLTSEQRERLLDCLYSPNILEELEYRPVEELRAVYRRS